MIISASAKIVVAITQRVDRDDGRNETRDALDQRLAEWLVQSGFLPVPVPNSILPVNGTDTSDCTDTLDCWLSAIKPQALILSGGNDIGGCPDRDATERHLMAWAEANRIPLLGICRGMQMMAVSAGGRLERVAGHVRTRHQLATLSGAGAFPVTVNSYHEWSIAACPEPFEVIAQSEDGAIEAIRHPHLPWEGWMWHPEREYPFDAIDTQRMTRLFRDQ